MASERQPMWNTYYTCDCEDKYIDTDHSTFDNPLALGYLKSMNERHIEQYMKRWNHLTNRGGKGRKRTSTSISQTPLDKIQFLTVKPIEKPLIAAALTCGAQGHLRKAMPIVKLSADKDLLIICKQLHRRKDPACQVSYQVVGIIGRRSEKDKQACDPFEVYADLRNKAHAQTHGATQGQNFKKLIECVMYFFRHARVSSTYPCMSVRSSVTHF